ncbi:serine hydrolase domain-containing protein [Pseudokineococcus marinus]|uniref:Beta-lactamase family protein n=1 Tax=Pseudokineococcus marinus TaxID=351215 RepID=A0A849BPT6_9ACTN|nr:serine hydrolase domain-containing protein [Pseudokineococcus marinus]NNH21566.1 beta-lactamase family protein [Pseudokineococcus marinus]
MTTPTTRRRTTLAASGALALALGLGACTTDPLPELAGTSADATGVTEPQDPAQQRLEERLQPIVDAGYPAALASVTSPDGTRVDAAVGTGDLATGAPVPVDGEVRVGSNTKPVVAVVVLQLVEEGLVALDEPVETYLPGLLRGDGVDGTAITVRDLLKHTSGLPEYTAAVAADPFTVRDRWISPRDMLDVALEEPATAAPGEAFAYTNTNYLTLGLLVERVTQRPLHEQVDERVVAPLGLEHTYLPAPGERDVRGEHPLGYHAQEAGELEDITAMDTSWAWAAGALVSTPSEMNAIMRAVLDGTLLSEASTAEMQRTVPAPDELYPEAAYGLGWQALPLSCGGVAWGHGGDIPGTHTRNAVGPDGTAVTIAVTALPFAVVDAEDDEALLDSYRLAIDALDAALCEA